MAGTNFMEYHSKKTKKKKSLPKALVRAILAFARDYDFTIHPFGIEYYVENYRMFGHCVCDRGRPACPCPEAVAEVRDDGFCKCRLYWKDLATFMEKQGWSDKEKGDAETSPSCSLH